MGALPLAKSSDDREFRRMIIVSVSVHLLLVGFAVFKTSAGTKPLFTPAGSDSMNVMWARPVHAGPKTPKWKLPGPRVQPKAVVTQKKGPKKIVLKKEKEKKPRPETEVDPKEEARQKAMQNAIASITQDLDDRPVPRADNFPSAGEGEAVVGGILGGPDGDPVLTAYVGQVTQIVSDNMIWLGRERRNAAVKLRIDYDGNILNPTIETGSGDPAYDQAVLRAIRKSTLPPPPQKVASYLVGEPFVLRFEKSPER